MKKPRFAIILLVVIMAGCSPRISNLDSTGRTIVCFGDSITEGFGGGKDGDYPHFLSRKVGRPVINAGVMGDVTADALARIEEDVLAHDPWMVIVILGGNDFMGKLPKAQTVANMEKIVERIHRHGAIVVIAAIKLGLIQDAYSGEFKRIAKEYGALYVPNVMKDILTTPKLKYDQIHPNADGYRIIAERVHKAIEPLL